MSDYSESASPIISREETMLITIKRYFNKPGKLDQRIIVMVEILNGTSEISLRDLDWFVTNFSKKYGTSYPLKRGTERIQFNVHLDYKKQLKGYSKQFFDPFARRKKKTNDRSREDKLKYYYTDNDYIMTTIGQLNFFRWAIKNKVVKFVGQNLTEIKTDMNRSSRRSQTDSETSTDDNTHLLLSEDSTDSPVHDIDSFSESTEKKPRKRRSELSTSATKGVNRQTGVRILLSFD